MLFHECDVQKPILSLGCLAQHGYWSDAQADTGTLFFPDRIWTRLSQTQLHKEESLVFVKVMLMAPLVTAGVSDDVAQESQMPMGPQAVEDVVDPIPPRPATLKDPSVLDQHSLTHFPSQPNPEDATLHIENIDAVVPQLQFDNGTHGSPLQIAWFFVGADTSFGAMNATMAPHSKKMDMPSRGCWNGQAGA